PWQAWIKVARVSHSPTLPTDTTSTRLSGTAVWIDWMVSFREPQIIAGSSKIKEGLRVAPCWIEGISQGLADSTMLSRGPVPVRSVSASSARRPRSDDARSGAQSASTHEITFATFLLCEQRKVLQHRVAAQAASTTVKGIGQNSRIK